MVKTALDSAQELEVGLVCDAGTSYAGIHGLTDLFKYAGEFAAKRAAEGVRPPVRITYWRVDADGVEVRCTYDSRPGSPHAPAVLVSPGNEQAPRDIERDTPLVAWLRARHAQGVVLAAVCGGVFILARTGLLDGRQATTHWAFSDQFAVQFPEVLTESGHMVIDYGDVVTAGGVLAWADLGLRLTERFSASSPWLLRSDAEMSVGDNAILKAQVWLLARRERVSTETSDQSNARDAGALADERR
jgi:transcriptional regulator GlxA family with amidase domain